jgi:protein tyrosine/serine phosphatase
LENEELRKELLGQVGREIEILANSHVKKLDVNFVSELKFNKIGDYNIYIGPYPQNEDDIALLSKADITAVLNVQTDLDMTHRQINWPANLNAYKKHEIEIVRYPIRDFDPVDLRMKLQGAAEKLKELLNSNKTVYVHCTAGMSRAAATVISYLVLFDIYSLDEAYEYVKFFRNIICPNMNVLSKVINNND